MRYSEAMEARGQWAKKLVSEFQSKIERLYEEMDPAFARTPLFPFKKKPGNGKLIVKQEIVTILLHPAISLVACPQFSRLVWCRVHTMLKNLHIMARNSGYHTGITLRQEWTDCSGPFF